MKKINNPEIEDYEVLSKNEILVTELLVDDNDFNRGEEVVVVFDDEEYNVTLDFVYIVDKKAYIGVDLELDIGVINE